MIAQKRIFFIFMGLVACLALVGGSNIESRGPLYTQEGPICFNEVPDCIDGRIATFWQEHGGLSVFGFPITPQRVEWIEGQPYQVQWFERNRLELHPENPHPYDVLIGRLGADRLAQVSRDWRAFPRSEPQPGCRYFAETGHNICGDMLTAWRSNGLEFDGWGGKIEAENLALSGLPLSDARTEMLEDGRTYTVQWFERTRLELHPQNPPPYRVLLGLLGRIFYEYTLPVSPDSPIIAPPRATARQATTYIINRGTTYTPYDVSLIASYYWEIAPQVGVDPLVAMAQCLHETDTLKSWWAQRPRRNPAGLGVTGEVSPNTPPTDELYAWAWNAEEQLWRKGLSFATWEDSTRAHIGRLLAYAVREGEATPAQQVLIREALALRPLPSSFRGIAPTLRGLNGRWAYPGHTYADKIVVYANAIRKQ